MAAPIQAETKDTFELAKLIAIVNSAPTVIVSLNSSSIIESWNKEAESLFGYSEAEAVGKNISLIIPNNLRAMHEVKFKEAVDTQAKNLRTKAIDAKGVSKSGAEVPLSIKLSSWTACDQLYFTAVMRDISAEHTLGEQLRQAQKLESTGRLAGGVAHDFNNLLTVILAVAYELEENPQADELKKNAKLLIDTANKAAALTRQLLVFSRQEVIKPEKALLHELINDTALMLQRIIGDDVKVLFNSQITSAIKVDKGQISQILVNLAVNSRDAMPNGGRINITVKDSILDEHFASMHPGMHAGPHVMLTFSDTGFGISPDILGRIFDPFFTTKPAGSGTGLGLSIVLGAVRQNNGCIEVVSTVGKGTTFTIYFPQYHEDESLTKKIAEVEQRAQLKTDYTILLVEDQADVRAVASTILRKQGYTVIEAVNGRDGVEKYKAQPGKIDLLITDIVMPEMGGTDLYDFIQKLRPNLPVIFMSGYAPDEQLNQKVIDKNFPYLPKPFTRESLIKLVQQQLK